MYEARTPSPFIERAESIDVVTDVFVLQNTAVPAVVAIAATGPMPSILPTRHRRLSWAGKQWRRLLGSAS